MDKRTVFADGLILARALKVLDHGVLVARAAEPVADARHRRRPASMDTKELVTDLYGRREARVEQNANDFHWGLDNWMHTADSDIYLRLKNGKFEVQQDARARRVGRDPRRRRADLPQHQRIVGPRRLRADAVLPAQPEPAAHARQLRSAARRRQRGQHRLAGAAQSGHQPRLSDRHRSPGRHARQVHVGLRAADLSRRPAAGGAVRQRVRRRAGRQPGQPHRPRATTAGRCGRARPTTRRSSSPPPTSASGRSSCPTPPTARSTSSTCIAA